MYFFGVKTVEIGENMKIIGICGSPKTSDSTTQFALEQCLHSIATTGIKTEIIKLGEHKFNGCQDCGVCSKQLTCSQDDDFTDKIMPLLNDSEIGGFVFASPVYFGGMSSQMKTFFDRAIGFRRNGFRWEHLVAGCLSVGRSRHGGQELTIFDMARAAMVHGMIVVPDSAPTCHFGANLWSGHPDGIKQDVHGINTAVNLGNSMAKIVKKLHS